MLRSAEFHCNIMPYEHQRFLRETSHKKDYIKINVIDKVGVHTLDSHTTGTMDMNNHKFMPLKCIRANKGKGCPSLNFFGMTRKTLLCKSSSMELFVDHQILREYAILSIVP